MVVRAQRCCLPVYTPESTFMATSCMANLRSEHQAEASGKDNRPFSLEDWGYVSI